jgi:hypothetical protein
VRNIFNASTKRVGGIRFFKLGRINISFSVSRKAPREEHRAVDRGAKRYARLERELVSGIAAVVALNIGR